MWTTLRRSERSRTAAAPTPFSSETVRDPSVEPGQRAALAADPAEQLLQLDLVEASKYGVVAHPKHRHSLPVELLPLPHRCGVAVDGPVFEFDTELVQELGHGR